MRKFLTVALVASLGACAMGETGSWQGADMSNLAHDQYECEKDARQTFGKPTLDNFDSMLGFARRCMYSKGYSWAPTGTVASAPAPARAPAGMILYKPQMTKRGLDGDGKDCIREAQRTGHIGQADEIQFGIACMQAKGYEYIAASSLAPPAIEALRTSWNQ